MDTRQFKLVSDYRPSGDQPKAIEGLVDGLRRGMKGQVMLGVTGSGKTYTMANVLAEMNKPTLVLAHNKTLAAQLYREFKELFPENAVEYFVSYYDYYLPEAYIPASDTYIEKDTAINDELDKMRIAATKHLLERRDVIIVASVSCIYGIGSPTEFGSMSMPIEEGQVVSRKDFLARLVEMLYQRGDMDFKRGTFRARGDVIDVFPSYEDSVALRISLFDGRIESIQSFDSLTGRTKQRLRIERIFPASHYVTSKERMERAMITIEAEMEERVKELTQMGRLLESNRIRQRTTFDLDMMREMGTCKGVENYSRHLTGRQPGERPICLLDYFGNDFLMFIDESHQTLPQVAAMYRGDQVRKQTLVDYGFRLPSALDNRPLKREEFQQMIAQAIYVSATPAEEELKLSGGLVHELVVRPTGLLDPPIVVRPASGQVDDLYGEVRRTVDGGARVLVTTLTKRFSEELVEHYTELGMRVRYLHSDIDAIERTRILSGLRAGDFDVLIGINLLREGLDLPEVELVAILDADKEGFLRSETSLIQTCGRAARNANGRVIMYADKITDSMQACIDETTRRRALQEEYNKEHGIEPKGIVKKLGTMLPTYTMDADDELALAEMELGDAIPDVAKRVRRGGVADGKPKGPVRPVLTKVTKSLRGSAKAIAAPSLKNDPDRDRELVMNPEKLRATLSELKAGMKQAAQDLEFEKAALIRDRLLALQKLAAMEG